MSVKARQKRANFALKALRMETLRYLLGGISFRHLSRALGSSDLLADFCRVRHIDGIRGISKSTLERASKFFSEEQLRALHRTLTEVVGDADLARQVVGLDKPIDTTICLIDGTCLEVNIHWPTDWVLLKDVAGTLLKAIRLIREKAGLRHRMPIEPEPLARQMNRLCIQMTHSRRRKDSARQRKGILRQMKKLLQTDRGACPQSPGIIASLLGAKRLQRKTGPTDPYPDGAHERANPGGHQASARANHWRPPGEKRRESFECLRTRCAGDCARQSGPRG